MNNPYQAPMMNNPYIQSQNPYMDRMNFLQNYQQSLQQQPMQMNQQPMPQQIAGINGINTNIMQTGYGIQQAINADTVANMQNTNALQSQLANCCCETREAIQGVNYNMATNTCALQNTMNNNTRDIIDSQQAGTRAILDFLTNDKIATLQAENNDLRRAASQDRQNALLTTTMAAQTNQIIDAVRPTPVPSFPASNLYGYAYGCGCNTGCGC